MEKKKPPEGGFCITGGSGEIRTRDQRIKRLKNCAEQLIKHWFKPAGKVVWDRRLVLRIGLDGGGGHVASTAFY